LASMDLAYPQLVHDVMPVFLTGFFLAVLLGAVFSSFNSLLNSAATLFCLDVYVPIRKGEAGILSRWFRTFARILGWEEGTVCGAVSDQHLIAVAKISSVLLALMSFVIAPLFMFFPEGLFQTIRKFTGFYNIPLIAIVLVGFFCRRVPALAAKVVIVFHVCIYGLFAFGLPVWVNVWGAEYTFWGRLSKLHFVHAYGVLFLLEVLLMLGIAVAQPRTEAWRFQRQDKVCLVPWRWAMPVASTLFCCILVLYLFFSPLGVVGGLGTAFWWILGCLIGGNLLCCVLLWRYGHPHYKQMLEGIGQHVVETKEQLKVKEDLLHRIHKEYGKCMGYTNPEVRIRQQKKITKSKF
ncbi:MAG: hypothetical protein AAGJ35_03575, partial [Myxococcota bacterium]